jgi:hypothetical protein
MKVFVGILVLLALLFGIALWVRMNFFGSLAERAQDIEQSEQATYENSSDLPPLARQYLHRVGIEEGRSAGHAFFEQKGQMKLSPDGDWTDFTAEQWMAVDHSAFLWWPTMAMPVGSIVGTDRLDGDAQLEMRIFGVVPVAKDTSTGLIEGELARYLAELPWNPAALAGNDALELEQVDDRHVRVTAVQDGISSTVTLGFDEDGDIVSSYAEERPRDSSPDAERHPWGGEFSDYREFDGVRVPTRGEVYWDLPDGRYTYWKCEILAWELR